MRGINKAASKLKNTVCSGGWGGALISGDLIFVSPPTRLDSAFGRAIAATGRATLEWVQNQAQRRGPGSRIGQAHPSSNDMTATHVAIVVDPPSSLPNDLRHSPETSESSLGIDGPGTRGDCNALADGAGGREGEDREDQTSNADDAASLSCNSDRQASPLGPVVVEATPGLGVRETTMQGLVDSFPRGTQFICARTKGLREGVAKAAAAIARSQVGKPYAANFDPPPESFYCSSLVTWAFKQAGAPPMVSEEYTMLFEPREFWEDYYEKQNMPLPSKPKHGSNPTLLLSSPLLDNLWVIGGATIRREHQSTIDQQQVKKRKIAHGTT